MTATASAIPRILKFRGIIDGSGSMEGWLQRVQEGVNAYMQTLKDDAEASLAELTLVIFDSLGIDILRKGVIKDIEMLKEGDLRARALTPLNDAVASGLNDNVDEGPNVKNILFVFTDGLENASKRYKSKEELKLLIAEKQAKGWVIIYLGANVNAWQEAGDIGIPPENAMNVHVQGTNAQPESGFVNRLRHATSNPVAKAMIAAAGLGLAYALFRPGSAHAAPHGFTDADRNAAMGVDGIQTSWQDAVTADIAGFNEPFRGIADLPADLHEQTANLPKGFDISKGSRNEDGEQTGGFDHEGDVLSADDVPSIVSNDGDDDDDQDHDENREGDNDDDNGNDTDGGIDGDADTSGDGDGDGVLGTIGNALADVGEKAAEAAGGLLDAVTGDD